MAHKFVVSQATAVNGFVRIVGTVDTVPSTQSVPVKVSLPQSAVAEANQAGGVQAVEALIAPLMLAQYQLNVSVDKLKASVVSQLPTGTFTQ